MRMLTKVSSRKSMESANKDTDPILNATENSTPNRARLNVATTATADRRLYWGVDVDKCSHFFMAHDVSLRVSINS
jgi:hypothetical protein